MPCGPFERCHWRRSVRQVAACMRRLLDPRRGLSQGRGEGPGRLEARFGRRAERTLDHGGDAGWNIRPGIRQTRGRHWTAALGDGGHRVVRRWRCPSQATVDDRAEGVLIRRRPRLAPNALLGREVRPWPLPTKPVLHIPVAKGAEIFQYPADPEVRHADRTARVQQHICGLQVGVDDPQPVRRVQRRRDLVGEPEAGVQVHRRARA